MCALPFQLTMLLRAAVMGCNTRDRMSARRATRSAEEQPAAQSPLTLPGANKSAGLQITTAAA